MSEDHAQQLHRGSGGSNVHKGKRTQQGDPRKWAGMTNRMPVRDRPAPWGGGEVRSTDDAG